MKHTALFLFFFICAIPLVAWFFPVPHTPPPDPCAHIEFEALHAIEMIGGLNIVEREKSIQRALIATMTLANCRRDQ